ncbi:hypothetical protein DM02DRAFT_365309 [Periconia macrospinosa]|uniref:Uncharacterized protein n=1 Tax=Periconia macrospinosa TaxID=97972 RepID=A0A2V1DV44_9PLEO|nr:hypothetical protein DM02DRAFT_365309 [Periconia macrospinosa]
MYLYNNNKILTKSFSLNFSLSFFPCTYVHVPLNLPLFFFPYYSLIYTRFSSIYCLLLAIKTK